MTPLELETLTREIAESVASRLNQQRRLLSRDELARKMDVSVPTIDRMRREGQIPFIKIRNAARYDLEAVVKHLAATTQTND